MKETHRRWMKDHAKTQRKLANKLDGFAFTWVLFWWCGFGLITFITYATPGAIELSDHGISVIFLIIALKETYDFSKPNKIRESAKRMEREANDGE